MAATNRWPDDLRVDADGNIVSITGARGVAALSLANGFGVTVADILLAAFPDILIMFDGLPLAMKSPETRSFALLKDWLSPEQRAEFERHGWFTVFGSQTGTRYIVTADANYNVMAENGSKYCFAPEDLPPTGDRMLAQKIALETDEIAALKVANMLPLASQCFVVDARPSSLSGSSPAWLTYDTV